MVNKDEETEGSDSYIYFKAIESQLNLVVRKDDDPNTVKIEEPEKAGTEEQKKINNSLCIYLYSSSNIYIYIYINYYSSSDFFSIPKTGAVISLQSCVALLHQVDMYRYILFSLVTIYCILIIIIIIIIIIILFLYIFGEKIA